MKNGLINENGVLIYYKNDRPTHAGVIEHEGSIYYIGKDGIAVTGKHIVHREMSNGLLKRGTYTFGEDGKLVKGSYIPPTKKKSHGNKSKFKHKSRKKKFDLKNYIKHHKKGVRLAIVSVITVICIFCLALVLDNAIEHSHDGMSENGNDKEIQLPTFEDEVYLCSKGAQMLYDGEITVAEALKYGASYMPLVFEYNLKGSDGVLLLSEHSDMSNATQFFMSKNSTYLKIDNLKTDTQYFYKVSVNEKEYHGTFKTAASTRFISVDGIYNTRDLGGYITLDGKTVRQGMIIRGTEMDGLVETEYRLTKESIEYMKSFGFVYDMDLRSDTIFAGDYTSALGEGVTHKFYSAPQYGQIFSAEYKENLRRIFSDLANPANYPMYLHCTYGADRTGTVAFLLQGVLNMSTEQMIREYQLTGFETLIYASSENMDIIISGLQNKEGDTLQEKIVNFLINDIGVRQEEIDSIRNVLLQ